MNESGIARFKFEGVEMAVRLAGNTEKPALLLLHGFPSSSESFRNVIGTLARDCFVIVPDLPGFGRSEPIEPPSFSHFADMIAELLEWLEVQSFHLYLHDFGAAPGCILPHARRAGYAALLSRMPTRTKPGWGLNGPQQKDIGTIPHRSGRRRQPFTLRLRGRVSSMWAARRSKSRSALIPGYGRRIGESCRSPADSICSARWCSTIAIISQGSKKSPVILNTGRRPR